MKIIVLVLYVLLLRFDYTQSSKSTEDEASAQSSTTTQDEAAAQSSKATQDEALFSVLFENYNRKALPVFGNDIVKIDVTAAILGINNVDEISGEIELTILFRFSWTDGKLKWNTHDYGNKSSLVVPTEDIWRPKFFLIESFEKIQEVGNLSNLVRINANGEVIFLSSNVLNVYCPFDVTYFPFDKQVCELTISVDPYSADEVLIYTTVPDIGRDNFRLNSEWTLQSAIISNNTNRSSPPRIKIGLAMKRKSDFFVVYIIIPIEFLGFINSLVFLMPSSSGERTSVAITAFLSFVIYMEMVNDNVPKSSDPVALIYYYVVFLLVYSSTIMFMSIISLRIHEKVGMVPVNTTKLITILRFRWLKRKRKTRIIPLRKVDSETETTEDRKRERNGCITNGEERPVDVTWKLVGQTYDVYCFIILSVVFMINSVIAFYKLYNNSNVYDEIG